MITSYALSSCSFDACTGHSAKFLVPPKKPNSEQRNRQVMKSVIPAPKFLFGILTFDAGLYSFHSPSYLFLLWVRVHSSFCQYAMMRTHWLFDRKRDTCPCNVFPQLSKHIEAVNAR